MVEFDDSLLWSVCKSHLATFDNGDLIIGMSPQQARRELKLYLCALELNNADLIWYSVRRGGATFYFKQFGNINKTLVKGRWESQLTTKLYIMEGMLALSETSFENATLRVLVSLALRFAARF